MSHAKRVTTDNRQPVVFDRDTDKNCPTENA